MLHTTMSKAKTNPKKSTKNLRNVLAQPLNIAWPRIPDNEIKRCSRLLQQVERKNITSGCNGVIKLLQTGQVLAFFVLDSFNPQIFAKLIIQMARRQNPSVLVLALPSFPVDCCRNSVLMAITKPKETEHSEPVQELLKWMKVVSARNEYVTKESKVKLESKRKKFPPKVKKPIDVPLTDEEVAKLYVFEPRMQNVPDTNQPKKRVAQEVESFISLSDNASSSMVVSKNEYQQHNEPRPKPITDDRKSFNGSYIPLTVNRVQGNPNRVEHKKKRKIKQ